jgi:hypothetical protein
MELILSEYLPKDLIYIIQDYSKDKTNYEKVIEELKDVYIYPIERLTKWHGENNIYSLDCYRIELLVNMLQKIRIDRERKYNEWYILNKKLKKPHGKRPPTYRDKRKKLMMRFGERHYTKYTRKRRNKKFGGRKNLFKDYNLQREYDLI